MLILRKVQIKPGTKVLLGFSLCLSFVMVIVTIVRVSGLRNGSNLDPVWDFYWQVVESCIAITMVSLTAFRSFFVQERIRRTPIPKRSWYQGVKTVFVSKSSTRSDEEARELPPIPRGRMTGLMTLIDANGRTSLGAGTYLHNEDSRCKISWPMEKPLAGQKINVRQEISVHSELVGCGSPFVSNVKSLT